MIRVLCAKCATDSEACMVIVLCGLHSHCYCFALVLLFWRNEMVCMYIDIVLALWEAILYSSKNIGGREGGRERQ